MGGTIVVAGSVAQRPGRGGHAWVFLQYLLGFRRLGWDVLFVDRLSSDMGVGPSALSELATVMAGFGLEDHWSVLGDGDAVLAGLPRSVVLERTRDAVLLIDVMGFLQDEELLEAASLTAFLDIDPGFGQMWQALGLADLIGRHDRYVTVGGRIGTPGCAIPTCGVEWTRTLPPVELSEWPPAETSGRPFTSVASWRGPFGPIEYEGRTYGLRVHELRRFAELPERSGLSFELALDIDSADAADRERLLAGGWRLIDPDQAAGDPWRYRDYVQRSGAELMVAKNLYVDAVSGWFSDRSACYLASGRPVLAQDTGLEGLIPAGGGLVLFSTLEEAVEGARVIAADPGRHGRAARKLAEEHLAAERVLPGLLRELGVT